MSLLDLVKLSNVYNLKVKGLAHFGAHKGEEVEEYRKLNYSPIHLFEPQKNCLKSWRNHFQEMRMFFYTM